jgi:hypothetical protein
MCADFDPGRQPERRTEGRPGPQFSPLTPHAREQREIGVPGGGAGRRDYVGGSGVYPASLGPGNIPHGAEIRTPAAWGQGERGAAGYEDSGRSELLLYGGQLLGAFDRMSDRPAAGPGGRGARGREGPGRESYGREGGFGGFGSQRYGYSEPGSGYEPGQSGRERRRGPRETYGMFGHGAVGPELEAPSGPGADYWSDADPRLGTRRDPERLDLRGAMGGEDYSYARPLGPQAFQGRPAGPHAGRGPKHWRRADERIREDVCEALTRHPAIDAGELEVDVREGVVTLRGAVENRTAKRLAEDIAESVSGVTDVQAEMHVHDPAGDRARPRDDEASRREERMGARGPRR